MHWFVIDLGMGFDSIFNVFWYLFRSRTQPAKRSKNLLFFVTINFNDVTFLKNMMFDDFHVLLHYQEFWHWFWLHFGTPLALNSMFVGDCFFHIFLNWNFIDVHEKWLWRIVPGIFIVAYLFNPFVRTLVPFTSVRSVSARSHFFNFFRNIKRSYPHL